MGPVRTVVLDGMDEFAVLTGAMSEAEFKKRAIAADALWQADGSEGIRQMIRAEV